MIKKKVVGVAGMPGAGKTEAVRFAEQNGCGVIVMGDEVRQEAKKRGLAPTPENLGRLMLELREKEGPAVIARRCIPKIMALPKRVVVVDGVRSLAEVREFRKHFPSFKIIAVHASPEVRFQRLFSRRRSDDPEKWESFIERDLRELEVGLGDIIAVADYMIVNEGGKEELKDAVNRILRHVMEDE